MIAAPPPDIFRFDDYSEYLCVRRQLVRRPRLTLSRWAKRMGYRSPRSIAMVLKKQRLPTDEMVRRFSDDLGHSDSEHRYFELLVHRERYRQRGLEAAPLERRLEALRPTRSRGAFVDATTFATLSDWHHLVIKQLVACPEFVESPMWISRRLKRKVSPAEVTRAIDRLIATGMLYRHPRSHRLLVQTPGTHTSDDIPSIAIREHHKQMLERAREAIEEEPIERREFTAKTIRIDPGRLSEAKADLRRFKASFEKKFYSDSSSSIFQLGIFLFEHTRPGGEGD